MPDISELKTVRLREDGAAVVILDQTRLPGREIYLELSTPEAIWEAIRALKVRGAPAIGITAAYGLYVASLQVCTDDLDHFRDEVRKISRYLSTARPTAVNLTAALNRMIRVLDTSCMESVSLLQACLRKEADVIREEDAFSCRKIGAYALSLLRPGMGLLTHCNAGHLAVSEYGTALAPVYMGEERGYRFKVFADETRPLLQGARLTAYELNRAGVDVTLICDNMVSSVMQKGWVQAVLVGCDRIACNGDVANKIGTSGVAVLARYYGIPFYVLGPTSTIDPDCVDGNSITIEERMPTEITELWYKERMAPEGINVYNPAFDVTPCHLISAIVTEQGVHYPPFHFGKTNDDRTGMMVDILKNNE